MIEATPVRFESRGGRHRPSARAAVRLGQYPRRQLGRHHGCHECRLRCLRHAAMDDRRGQGEHRAARCATASPRPSANGPRRQGASSPTTSPSHHLERLREMPGRAGFCAALPAPACIWASSATSAAAFCGWRPSIWAGPAISASWSGPRTPPWTSRPSSRWIWPWRRAGSPRGPDVWFVGDTDIDMHCAVNAGCLPVLVRREAPGAGEFDAYPPALHLRDCAGLAARLHALGVLPSPNI